MTAAFLSPRVEAQTAAATQEKDSTYLARMNAGYAAGKAKNQALAAIYFDSAALVAPQVPTPRVAAGYALAALNRTAESIVRFEQAIAIDANLDVVRRQLGYLYAGSDHTRDAIAAFAYLQSQNRASAQDFLALGNLNAKVDEREVALKAFHDALTLATQIGDTVVMKASTTSIKNLSSSANSKAAGGWLEYYVSPFYQNRFDNVVTYGIVRAGITSGGFWRPSAYLSLRATRDSKSVGGLQPVLFADNSAIPALGVRIQPGRWLTVYAEAGAAYPLVSVRPRNWHRDIRAGALAGLSNTHPLVKKPNGVSLISDVYVDATWYDRFNRNVITYGQWRESLRVLQGKYGAIDFYSRAWGSFDSRHDYYNRVVEGGGGVAIHLGASMQSTFYVEALRGHYLNEPTALQPKRNYNDFRVMFATGIFRSFPFAKP